MTEDSCVLLSVFCSPGTGSTSTVIGTFWPVGGCLLSGIVTVLISPAAIVSIVSSGVGVAAVAHGHAHDHVGLGVLALVLDLDLEGQVAGQLHRGGAAGRERRPAERDAGDAVAVQAGRGRPVAARAGAQGVDLVGDEVGLEPFDVGDEPVLREVGRGQLLVSQHVEELGPEALRVDHVAGEEDLHLLRDVVRALAPVLVAERDAQRVGDVGEPVAAQLEHLEQLALGALEVAGHVERLGAVDAVAGRGAVAVQLVDDRRGLVGAALALEQLEELVALLLGLAQQLGRVGRRSP